MMIGSLGRSLCCCIAVNNKGKSNNKKETKQVESQSQPVVKSNSCAWMRSFFCCLQPVAETVSVVPVRLNKVTFFNGHQMSTVGEIVYKSIDSFYENKSIAYDLKPNNLFGDEAIIVGDLEGELSSLITAFKQLGASNFKVNVDPNLQTPYILPEFKYKNKINFLFLGDVVDRGVFGLNTLLTLKNFFEMKTSFEKIFLLGNHDLAYLLLDPECENIIDVRPSICRIKADPGLSNIVAIFHDMNNKGHLDLIRFDKNQDLLLSHAVFTAGKKGFLKQFIKFVNQNQTFKDLCESKKVNIEVLLQDEEKLNWARKHEQKLSYMIELEKAVNLLINQEFIGGSNPNEDQKQNRRKVRMLLLDPSNNSFVLQKGLNVNHQFDHNFGEKMFKLSNPFEDGNHYPLRGTTQINGHYHGNSFDPGVLLFNKADANFLSIIYKCDLASSSGIQGLKDSRPNCMKLSQSGFEKFILQLDGSKTYKDGWLAKVKQNIVNSYIDYVRLLDLAKKYHIISGLIQVISVTSIHEIEKYELDSNLDLTKDEQQENYDKFKNEIEKSNIDLRFLRFDEKNNTLITLKSNLPLVAKVYLSNILNSVEISDVSSDMDVALFKTKFSTQYDFSRDFIIVKEKCFKNLQGIKDIKFEDEAIRIPVSMVEFAAFNVLSEIF